MALLVAGFVLSLLGTIPPGLISLSVSQTSIKRGLAAAMALAIGAAFAEFFQAWTAIALTDWFLSHPMAERGFQFASVPVFFALGFHLLFWAKPLHTPGGIDQVSHTRQFFKGIVLSAFNLLAIPYWFVYCAWLRMEGWWESGLQATLIFALGVSIGTIFALTLYAWLGQIILRSSSHLARFANPFIGLIFLGLGIKALYGLMV